MTDPEVVFVGNEMYVRYAEWKSLNDELLALREANRWIPVNERLPELTEENHWGTPQRRVFFIVDGVVKEGVAMLSRGDRIVFYMYSGNGFLLKNVSHWMPRVLPSPPEGL